MNSAHTKPERVSIYAVFVGTVLLGIGTMVQFFPSSPVDSTAHTATALEHVPERSIARAASPEPENDDTVQYMQIIDSCGPYFTGVCVSAHAGPGEEYPVVRTLRTGIVLKVDRPALDRAGRVWYKVAFDEWLRYPTRVATALYVPATHVRVFESNAPEELAEQSHASSTKRIIVDRSEQMLYAYEGDVLVMKESISTGIELSPTPRGIFTIYKRTPTRYMQGPLPGISADYYDLPGVPWNLYFTKQGAVIHGAYWHDKFGQPRSHGCVNVPIDKAEMLYNWADIGTTVIVRD